MVDNMLGEISKLPKFALSSNFQSKFDEVEVDNSIKVNRKISAQQKSIFTATNEAQAAKMDNELLSLKVQLKASHRTLVSTEKRLIDAEKRLIDADKHVAEAENRASDAEKLVICVKDTARDTSKKFENLQNQYQNSTRKSENEISKLKRENLKLKKENSRFKNEVAKLKSTKKGLEQERDYLHLRVKDYEKKNVNSNNSPSIRLLEETVSQLKLQLLNQEKEATFHLQKLRLECEADHDAYVASQSVIQKAEREEFCKCKEELRSLKLKISNRKKSEEKLFRQRKEDIKLIDKVERMNRNLRTDME
eukprot:g354.t1